MGSLFLFLELFIFFTLPFKVWKEVRKEEEKGKDESSGRNGTGNEDHKTSLGNQEGLAESVFQHWTQYIGQDKGRALVTELPHYPTDHSEENHHVKIEDNVVQAIGSDQAKKKD